MFKILNVLLTSWLIERAYIQSEIVCSREHYSWNDAMRKCRPVVHGTPTCMSFNGITGQSIEKINIRPDVTVWTSDFLYWDFHEIHCLCSFHYLTKDNFYKTSEEIYSECDAFRYFFCRNITTNEIEVLNNTWSYHYQCGLFHVNDSLRSILKPGFYWAGQTANNCGKVQDINKWHEWNWPFNPILCGAYSVDAGRHYRICNTRLRYVYASSGQSSSEHIDDSCFLANTKGTTDLSTATTLGIKSYQTQSTKASENITSTDSDLSQSQKQSSTLSRAHYVTPPDYTTQVQQISTQKIAKTSETKINYNITVGHAKGPAHEHGDPDTETDAGTIAGIVVGVCLALTSCIVLFILIHRRYRCIFGKNTTSNSMPETNNGTNNQPKKSKAHTLFNNIGYDTWDDNKKQNHTKQSKQNNTEISINGMSRINQLRTAQDEEPYYNQSNATYVNDTTETQMPESSYSFAVETENNVGKNEMSLDEYDTTISTRKGVYKTENLYNKFEHVNNSSSDVYDSTLHQGQSFETDDVYNKLSCNTKYGKFGTTLSDNEDYDSVGNTLKSQNTQHSTDNVYN